MLKRFAFIILLPFILYGYDDKDMDGVDDAYDKCLYTPFSDLVGSDGCSIKSLISEHHYEIKTGVSYSDTDYNTLSKTNTIITSLQLDYYYKNFSLNLATSYYSNEGSEYKDSGMNDSLIAASYTFAHRDIFVELGGGLILPTYETSYANNKTDYYIQININYNIEDITLFGAYNYTIVNDTDIENIASYQNSNMQVLGIGYAPTHNSYLSSSYAQSDSIYKGVDMIKTLSIYGYYALNENIFVTSNYAYGLSNTASDNYISLKLGYYY